MVKAMGGKSKFKEWTSLILSAVSNGIRGSFLLKSSSRRKIRATAANYVRQYEV